MIKQLSNSLLSLLSIDSQPLEEKADLKPDSVQDKHCSSTSGETSIEEFLMSDEEEFLLEIARKQHKVTNYIGEEDIAYSSRSNILTWASKLLNAVTLTNKQKQSIFHRFSTAYDLINEKLFIEKHPLQEDNAFKKVMVSLFLIVYKLEGYTIGKITIKSLIEAFLKEMKIKQGDIRKSEVRIMKLFDYNYCLFENNLHNSSLLLLEVIKKKYSLTNELSHTIEQNLGKMNRIVQFSEDIVFNIYPIDKAAISVYALILVLRKTRQSNPEELYTYQLISYEMALLINNMYAYLQTVLKVITITQIDFKHYSSLFAEKMINKEKLNST